MGRSSVVAATRVYAFLDNVNDIFHLETLSQKHEKAYD